MNRRRRSAAFLTAALLAALAAGLVADGYGRSVVRGYGELRPVVVAVDDLRAGERIDPRRAASGLEVRRVPVRFAPPAALAAAPEALGLAPAVTIPAGSYLLASELRRPGARRGGTPLGHGRRPVEIAIDGAGALSSFGTQPVGSRVDVVVTAEPSGSGPGRTYVAASSVPLLALGPGAEGGPGEAAATLGLTRPQALRLIAAESFARRVTVLPRG
ncbi:MAG TPA: SAF domain-containing protein [Solirubrobacterales bacterium]|nr:SAF domain-containing protein [Solirubrobacterales bacterium]